MLRFLTYAFAIIGILVTAVIIASAVVAVHVTDRKVAEPASVVLSLDFDQPIVERNDESPLIAALNEQGTPLFDILHAIDTARVDPHVKGIVGNFSGSQPSLEQAQEIRAALQRFRTSGKFTYAFGSDYGEFGQGNRAYYLASAFENIWLQPVGSVSLSGLAIEAPFAKTGLEKIGVKADFMQREEYKSFMEMGMRDDYSPLVRIETQEMLNNLSEQIAGGIAESRKWDVAHVKQLMEQGPYTDDEALKAGLITRIGYSDELDDEIKDKAGADAKQVDVEEYTSYTMGHSHGNASHAASGAKPATQVALIYGDGMIVDKAGASKGLGGDHVMGADTISDAFDDAADDKNIKAILFRIDSPGGSPAASETIRRAMMHAQKKGKPVFVSMGEVAASGGYWIAMNADYIAAEPGTLTGSIGVVAGKFILSGLMEKLGITWQTLKTTDNAGMWSMTNEFTPLQRERMNALLDNTYHTFLQDVSSARKIPMEKMPDIAKGRVWTGDQAVKIGLIDELGGYDVTLVALRKKLNLSESDPVSLEPFPPPETPTEKVLKLLKGLGIESAMINAAIVKLGNLEAALGPFLQGITGPQQPLAARMSPELLRAVH